MKNNNRINKINDEIKKQLSEIIRSEIKDPRVSFMTSVLKVETTTDLKHCKVFISVLGDETQKEDALKGLKNASGFIRKQIATKINLRCTPEFYFFFDDSIEYSDKINRILNQIKED